MLRSRSPRLLIALAVVPFAGLMPHAAGAQTPSAGATPEVIARGLDNPRGLAIGADGAIWVAEAGRGGRGPCVQGPEGGRVCVGATGALTRIVDGRKRRVLRGLPSIAERDGSAAAGPHDVSVRGGDQVWFTVDLAADPRRRSRLGPLGSRFAQLFRFTESGTARAQADIGAHEARRNPDQDQPGSELDTNPTAVLAQASRRLVVDAGGNSLLSVDGRGRVSTLATFAVRTVGAPGGTGPPAGTPIPMQAVPTSVAQDRRGALYVSQLTGFPFPRGGARIYKVVPGSAPQVFAAGFTNVVDLAFGPDGSLYVLEITTNGLLSNNPAGALIRLLPNGSRQPVATAGLTFPGGVTVADNGDLYVTNRAASARIGQVLRIRARG